MTVTYLTQYAGVHTATFNLSGGGAYEDIPLNSALIVDPAKIFSGTPNVLVKGIISSFGSSGGQLELAARDVSDDSVLHSATIHSSPGVDTSVKKDDFLFICPPGAKLSIRSLSGACKGTITTQAKPLNQFPASTTPAPTGNVFQQQETGIFYWDSLNHTGSEVDSDPVSTIPNLYSGGTITGSQTGVARPTWRTSSYNGNPSLEFDGVDDEVIFSDLLVPAGNSDFTVMGLFKRTNSATRLLGIGDNSGTNTGLMVELGFNTGNSLYGSNTQQGEYHTAIGGSTFNDNLLIALRHDSSTGEVTINVYGEHQGTTSFTLSSPLALTGSNSQLMVIDWISSNEMGGNVAGLASYSSRLSDSNLFTLVDHWLSGYGLPARV